MKKRFAKKQAPLQHVAVERDGFVKNILELVKPTIVHVVNVDVKVGENIVDILIQVVLPLVVLDVNLLQYIINKIR